MPVWPSNMAYFVSRMMRQTHHAPILENWGALWMWHSLMVLFQCGLTALLAWQAVDSRWPYLLIWGVGLDQSERIVEPRYFLVDSFAFYALEGDAYSIDRGVRWY